jgi:hypothetical protein
MTKIYLPYQNDEVLSAEEFFRDLGKAADAEDLAILNEDARFSDIPPHPLSKMFGEPEIFDRPATEPKTVELQKSSKILETRIGNSVICAEIDEKTGAVVQTFLKGTR